MNFLDEQVKVNLGFLDQGVVYEEPFVRSPNFDEESVLEKGETVEQAKARIKEIASNTFKEEFNKSLNKNTDAKILSSNIIDQENKLFDLYSVDDLQVEPLSLALTPYYNSVQSRFLINYPILMEKFEEAFVSKEDQGWLGWGLDFLDRDFLRAMIVSATPIGEGKDVPVFNAKTRTQVEGSRVLNNLVDLPPNEFKIFAKEYIEELMEEGVFRDKNVFALQQGLREAQGLGFNPDKLSDKIFGVFDLLGLGSLLKGTLVGGLKGTKFASITANNLFASTPSKRAGSIKGVEAANEVITKTSDEINPVVQQDMGSSAVDLNKGGVRPSAAASENLDQTKKLSEILTDYDSSIKKQLEEATERGAIPSSKRYVLETVEGATPRLDAAIAEAISEFQKATSSRIYDTEINTLPLNKIEIKYKLGTDKKGTPFSLDPLGEVPESLQNLANRVDGEIVPIDPGDLNKGYVVETNFETLNLEKGFDFGEQQLLSQSWNTVLGSIIDNPLMASVAVRDTKLGNELALRSVAAEKFMRPLAKPQQLKLEKLRKKSEADFTTLNNTLDELRNGPGSIGRNEWSDTEFQAEFMKQSGGKKPSDEVIEAYKASQDLDEANYWLAAQHSLEDYIRKGYKNSVEVEEGIRIPAKRVKLSSLARDAKIYNKLDDSKLYKLDYTDLPRNQIVWKLDSPWNKQEYVIFPREVGPVSYDDVLGKKAYGRRTNPEERYFVMATLDDNSVKTLLGAATVKNIKKAKEQLTNIQEVYIRNSSEEVINKTIRDNSDWNPSLLVNTLEVEGKSIKATPKLAMDQWLKENNIDLFKIKTGSIQSKARDTPIEDLSNEALNGVTASEYVYRSQSRAGQVLTTYGGAKAYNPSSINSIRGQYGSLANQYSNNFHQMFSMQQWLKHFESLENAKTNLRSINSISKSDYKKRFLEAEISGSTPEELRLKETQNILKRRMKIKSKGQRFAQIIGDQAYEKFVETTGKKWRIENPEGKILQAGFFTVFGANPSQLLIQGSQILNISAILGNPRTAYQATAGSFTLRKILYSLSDDVKSQDLALTRWGKNFGKTQKETDELVQLFRDVNPNIVMGDAAELATGITKPGKFRESKLAFEASKLGRSSMKLALTPFNQGESAAKSTAFMGAAFEFQAKFPKKSLVSEEGRNYVLSRMETLSNNMSTVSRSAAQYGYMAIPTQWTSYLFRTLEQIFVGRDLTKAERVRLGFITMPFYGFTGLMADKTAANLAEYFGEEVFDPNTEEGRGRYIALNNGFLDGFLNYYTPFDTQLSTRLGLLPGLKDLHQSLTQDNIFELAGGPSGGILYSSIQTFYNLVSNISNGYTSTLTEDTVAILKNFSAINNISKAVGILRDDVYRSRKGIKVPVEVDTNDAIVSLLGFTPTQVLEFYAANEKFYDTGKQFKKVEKELRNRAKVAWGMYIDNPQKARRILIENKDIISKLPYSYSKKKSLLNLLDPPSEDIGYILRRLVESGRDQDAKWFKSLTQ